MILYNLMSNFKMFWMASLVCLGLLYALFFFNLVLFCRKILDGFHYLYLYPIASMYGPV